MAKSSALGIDTPFVHVEAYLLVGCMALFVTVQVGLLNKALVSLYYLYCLVRKIDLVAMRP